MNWYIHIGSQNVGPIAQQEIQAMIKRGEVGPSTPVWREGMGEWVRLSLTELGAGGDAAGEKNMIEYYLGTLKKYAVFRGRARRSEYWFFLLCNFIVSCCLLTIGALTKTHWLDPAYRLATMVPIFAVAVRRMHDVNKSGWFAWVPFYNLYLACSAGTVGDNRFGPDPKNPFNAPTSVPAPLKKAA